MQLGAEEHETLLITAVSWEMPSVSVGSALPVTASTSVEINSWNSDGCNDNGVTIIDDDNDEKASKLSYILALMIILLVLVLLLLLLFADKYTKAFDNADRDRSKKGLSSLLSLLYVNSYDNG